MGPYSKDYSVLGCYAAYPGHCVSSFCRMRVEVSVRKTISIAPAVVGTRSISGSAIGVVLRSTCPYKYPYIYMYMLHPAAHEQKNLRHFRVVVVNKHTEISIRRLNPTCRQGVQHIPTQMTFAQLNPTSQTLKHGASTCGAYTPQRLQIRARNLSYCFATCSLEL